MARMPPGRIIIVLLFAPTLGLFISVYSSVVGMLNMTAQMPRNETVAGPYLGYLETLFSSLIMVLTNPMFVAGVIAVSLVLGVVTRRG